MPISYWIHQNDTSISLQISSTNFVGVSESRFSFQLTKTTLNLARMLLAVHDSICICLTRTKLQCKSGFEIAKTVHLPYLILRWSLINQRYSVLGKKILIHSSKMLEVYLIIGVFRVIQSLFQQKWLYFITYLCNFALISKGFSCSYSSFNFFESYWKRYLRYLRR